MQVDEDTIVITDDAIFDEADRQERMAAELRDWTDFLEKLVKLEKKAAAVILTAAIQAAETYVSGPLGPQVGKLLTQGLSRLA
jgi:hypothetical protein